MKKLICWLGRLSRGVAEVLQNRWTITLARNTPQRVLLSGRQGLAAGLFAAVCALPADGGVVQLVSAPGAGFTPARGGGGNSGAPIISADARFVLFSSTANNLVLTSNNTPIQAGLLPVFNVYLRDRSSQTTALVSVNLAGNGGGNGDSMPMGLSTNGRYALFESSAGNLVAGDTNSASDVFVRDLLTGTTVLVSATAGGWSGNGASRSPVMTPDGRYVAFASAATNLVAGDTNGIIDVFLRDLQTGSTVLVSDGAANANSSASESPEISDDGRYVAFYSSATNLVAGVARAGEVYVRDVVAGNTVMASTNAPSLFQSVMGTPNAVSCNHKLSADGTYVVFEACTNTPTADCATGLILRYNLASGVTELAFTNAWVPLNPFENIAALNISPDGRFVVFVGNAQGFSGTNTAVYLWDAQSASIEPVSVDWNHALPAGAFCQSPSISPDGRYVAFLSSAALTANALPGQHLYVRDVQLGNTKLVDVNTNGIGAGVGVEAVPQLSADGGLVVFESAETGLVPGNHNHHTDVYARNLAADTTELVSAHDAALASQTAGGQSSLFTTSVSSDGRYVAFASYADDLVFNHTNGLRDVFVRNLALGTNLLVSVNTNGQAGSGNSCEPAVSGDGRYVAFSSYASDLVAGDTNQAEDVFVRDLLQGTTALVSVNSSGTGSGNGDSHAPILSLDGRYVLFRSKATRLTADTFSGVENLFLRDLQAGTTLALTTAGGGAASMTPDGRYVAYEGLVSAASYPATYVWDTRAGARIATNSMTPSILSISPDGNRIAGCGVFSSSSLSIWDRAAKTSWTADSGYFGPRAGLRFSQDGRFLSYAKEALYDGTNQVYLLDCEAKTVALVSRSTNGWNTGHGPSEGPIISADGRFVAYRSGADNLVAGDTNGVPDVFLYDRVLGTTTLLGENGGSSPDNRSLAPVFSGDSRMLLFQSWASDLVANDFNQSSDLVAFYLLYANLTAGPGGPSISWPAVSGKNYRVQFKNNLGDDSWHDVAGPAIIMGNRGYLTDSAPDANHRFYRVLAN